MRGAWLSAALLCAQIAWAAGANTEAADAAIAAKDWARAEQLARELTRTAPEDAGSWLRLASAQHGQARYEEALSTLERAQKAGAGAVLLNVRRARALSRTGKLDAAFEQLDAAVGNGFTQTQLLETDEDFAALRGHGKYKPLLLKIQKAARPCEHDALYRQLDFWMGEWDVSQAGTPVGKSRVERILNSCVLLENWESANTTGKSFNLYDRASGRWKQTWVDSSGTLIEFTGGLQGSAMEFFAQQLLPKKAKLRMTFTPLGKDRVRQLIEQSDDDGKTWASTFDGLYQRRGTATAK